MVHTCVVNGCTNRSSDEVKRKFYTIPAVRLTEGERTEELSRQRRLLWISRINRKNFQPSKYSKLCSDHFITGDKADLYDFTNPDWAPSLKMNAASLDKNGDQAKMNRHERMMNRRETQKMHTAAATLVDLHYSHDISEEPTLQSDPEVPVCSFLCEGTLHSQENLQNEKDMEDNELPKKMRAECQRLLSENASLKQQIEDRNMNIGSFQGNDKKVTYYTGLPSFLTMMGLFDFIEPYIPPSTRIHVTKFQKFVLTLMRLRLNMPVQDLAYRFNIGTATVSRIFVSTLHVIYEHIKDLIYWPTREELRKTMPMEFRKNFQLKVAIIIDCFEIFIERPSNLRARATTYSSYKRNNTVKYLIGITPQGSISFLSDAWGGRASDKHITEHSGFLDKLLPGDIVLADRGFDIKESVGLMSAEVKIPDFTKGKTQLSGFEIENTRKIAHVRIHVERVIGLLRNKYQIVSDTMPVDYLDSSAESPIPVVDKIVTVCCALTNLCEPVIPFD